MDLRKLKKLIDLVEESGISELELTEGEEKFVLAVQHNNLHRSPYNTLHNLHNNKLQHLWLLHQPLQNQRQKRYKVT